jgi:hypothetical protein
MISILLNWILFLAYPNLFEIKDFIVDVVVNVSIMNLQCKKNNDDFVYLFYMIKLFYRIITIVTNYFQY